MCVREKIKIYKYINNVLDDFYRMYLLFWVFFPDSTPYFGIDVTSFQISKILFFIKKIILKLSQSNVKLQYFSSSNRL